MTIEALYEEIRKRFLALDEVPGLMDSAEPITIRTLTANEILGTAERTDFPILEGKEIIQQASYRGGNGQAFTSCPVNCSLTLKELCGLPLDNIRHYGIFIAGINAVMDYLGLTCCNIHCRDDGPEYCGKNAARVLMETYGDVKIALIGYQPCLFRNLSETFTQLRVTDLVPDKIGTWHFGRLVEHGTNDLAEVYQWADLILCTGSTLTNGTIVDFLSSCKKVLFYGTTISGAAALMDWRRLCFAETNGR